MSEKSYTEREDECNSLKVVGKRASQKIKIKSLREQRKKVIDIVDE